MTSAGAECLHQPDHKVDIG
uniref:Uncharacterized protein n=1 Tax=Arundo donax TaxID=35708 RepID=A0A0A8YW92_ARUDO